MEITEEIKNRIDIVDFISGYITLKRAGRNFSACCPFHNEKSPSFMVSPEKQIWHCFGCNEGGDVIGFFMKTEGLNFPEAIEQLAARANIVLPKEYKNPQKKEKKTNLYKVEDLACQIYQKILYETPWGEDSMKYYLKRGLTDKTIKRFRLGVSPKNPNFVSKILKEKGYPENILIDAGIAVKKGNGVTDRFIKRLMFPITDISGRIIGFSARVLDSSLPKYINSSDSPIYNKSQALYGLAEAKKSIRERDSALLVEGQMDVLACFENGIENAVASSGTALTEGQLNLIKRFSLNLKFCFDMDAAGVQATERGIELALKNDFNVEVIAVPSGKDPADTLKEEPEKFRKAIEESVPALQYFINEGLKNNDIETAKGKKDFSVYIVKKINLLSNAVERNHWIKEITRILDVTEKELNIVFRKNEFADKNAESKPAQKDLRSEMENNLLGLSMLHSKYISFVVNNLKKDEISEENRDLFSSLSAFKKKKFSLKLYFKEFPELEEKAKLLSLQAEYEYGELDDEAAGDEILFTSRRIKELSLTELLGDLLKKIRSAEKENNKDLQKTLLLEYNSLLLKRDH